MTAATAAAASPLDHTDEPPGARCCENVAATMIGHFATRLEVEARKRGGSLTLEAIHAITDHFVSREMRRFQPVFQRSFDECTRDRDSHQWEAARRQLFDRLLIKKFAHLFPPRRGDDGGQGILSRRLIPGFKLAITKMIGPALYEQCQKKAEVILERHRKDSGRLDWKKIHADPEVIALINDVLVLMAHYFTNYQHRRSWFLDIVNSHLPAPESEDGDPHWQLTEHGFSELMRALFADLHQTMRAHPRAVHDRYGEQNHASLVHLFEQLGR